jgi:ferredoxin
VRHVATTECELCGECTVDDDEEAIWIVEDAIKEAGSIDKVELGNIYQVPELCDHCGHMLSKDD